MEVILPIGVRARFFFFFYVCREIKGEGEVEGTIAQKAASDLPQNEILQKYNTELNDSCVGRAGSMVSLYPFATGFRGIFLDVIGPTKLGIQSSGFGQADLAGQEG